MTPHWATAKVASSRAQELLALDFTEPVEQEFPQSAADMIAFGFPSPVAIYDYEEAAGNVLDHVGSNDLTPGGAGTLLQNRTAVGLWDGSSMTGYKCVEMHDEKASPGEYCAAANNTIYDYGANDSFAFLQVFKVSTGYPIGSRATAAVFADNHLLSKVDGTTGYRLRVDGPGNSVLFTLASGGTFLVPGVSGSFSDGAWHYALVVVDRTAQLIYLHTDLGNNTSASIVGIGSPSNTTIFTVGWSFDNGNNVGGCYKYTAVWEGANAEGIQQADLDAWWKHASDPTGLLTTMSHSGSMSCEVASGPLVCDYSTDTYPPGYDAGFAHATKLGLQCRGELTNLIESSDRFFSIPWTGTPWVPTSITINNDPTFLDTSPKGMDEANRLLATANNATIEHLFVSTASTVYTFGMYIKRFYTMGADVTGRLIAYDATGAAEVSSLAFTATDTWQWIELTWTSNVGQISTGFRIEIDNDTDALTAFRATAVEADWIYPIYSEYAAAIAGATDFEVAGVDGQYARGGAGEIEVVAACKDSAVTSIERFLADIRNGNANNDRRSMSVRSDEKMRVQAWDSSAVSAGSVDSAVYAWNVERTCRMQWRSVGFVPVSPSNHLGNIVAGTAVGGIAGSWTSMNQAETVYVGSDGQASPANQLNGIIATLNVFNKPRAL